MDEKKATVGSRKTNVSCYSAQSRSVFILGLPFSACKNSFVTRTGPSRSNGTRMEVPQVHLLQPQMGLRPTVDDKFQQVGLTSHFQLVARRKIREPSSDLLSSGCFLQILSPYECSTLS